MKKKPGDYSAYVVDMDGTLYFQKPVRIKMAMELLKYYLLHPFRINELLAIKKYREVREEGMFSEEEGFEDKQYDHVSSLYNIPPDKFREIQEYWMIQCPLKYISMYKNYDLIDFLEKKISKGSTVTVYSDYPVENKLEAVGLKPTYYFSPADPEINCMKPDSKGLKYIISLMNVNEEDILFIGDRMEKDGECAKKCGVDFYLVGRNFKRDFLSLY